MGIDEEEEEAARLERRRLFTSLKAQAYLRDMEAATDCGCGGTEHPRHEIDCLFLDSLPISLLGGNYYLEIDREEF